MAKQKTHKTLIRQSDIEREVVTNTFYNLGLRLSEREYHIDELVIRHDIWKFLNNRLRNTEYYAYKEEKHKNDILIKKHNEDEPNCIYEIKTGLKPNGTKLDIKGVYTDIIKLAKQKRKNQLKKAYLILIGRTNKIVQGLKDSKLNFDLKYDYEKKKLNIYKNSFEFIEKYLPTGKEIDVVDLKKTDYSINLRYSNCHQDYNIMVISFEILSYKQK